VQQKFLDPSHRSIRVDEKTRRHSGGLRHR
jgi:hypothetical protein